MLLTADLRAEEAARKAEAKEKRRRELEIMEAEKDAAKMAELLNSDPEVRIAGVLLVDRSQTAYVPSWWLRYWWLRRLYDVVRSAPCAVFLACNSCILFTWVILGIHSGCSFWVLSCS